MHNIILSLLLINFTEKKLAENKKGSEKNINQSENFPTQPSDQDSPIEYEKPLRKGGYHDIFPYWIDTK